MSGSKKLKEKGNENGDALVDGRVLPGQGGGRLLPLDGGWLRGAYRHDRAMRMSIARCKGMPSPVAMSSRAKPDSSY